MMALWLTGTLGVTLVYVLLALEAARRVRNAPSLPTVPADSPPFVSIIVAARDEEEALPRCLAALRTQDYPAGCLEVLIADDHSSDTTAAIIEQAVRKDARFRYIRVPDAAGPLRGKAHALHTAIQAARGDLLLFTDADCTPPPSWARHLSMQFEAPQTGVVCGVTLIEHRTLLDRVQALDWLLLLTMAAAASEAGRPITAQGNNMAVCRAAYEAVGGYPALPFSVTEDYLLFRTIHETTGWQVRLVADATLKNRTRPLPTLPALFSQRKRWARGGLRAPAWVYPGYAAIFLTHMSLVAGLFIAPLPTLALLSLKVAVDALVLSTGARKLETRAPFSALLAFEAYLFGYLLLMPFALLLTPRSTWKGRKV